ncbi:MAG: ABC transporter substrate-binding protein [Candidatus Eisenbacteria bacterium]|nr:ABC transporter substrate-binding protein [Candidatus Eisenbacteria bacterium]
MPRRRFLIPILALLVAGVYALGHLPKEKAPRANAPREAFSIAQPLRILSLSPNITEILFRLGLGDEVVGVTDFCRFPPEAATKPKVGALLNPNIERMFLLEPSLVIALPAHGDLPEKLAARGIRALVLRNDTVADVLASIDSIGAAARREREAGALVDSIRARVAAARSDPPARRWKAMIVVSRTPGTVRDVFVAGPGTFLDELLRTAGGANVFSESIARYPEPSAEEILYRNPEAIIEIQPLGRNAATETALARADWAALPGLAAAERGNVFVLVGDHLVVPGPRLGETLRDLAAVLREVR